MPTSYHDYKFQSKLRLFNLMLRTPCSKLMSYLHIMFLICTIKMNTVHYTLYDFS